MGNAGLPQDSGNQGSAVLQRSNDDQPPPKKPGSKEKGRKRTKTGCLTCRKRRIKCGEERPTCQNCIKSKRQCEGYNQRVVFKDPLSSYRPSIPHGNHLSQRQSGLHQQPNLTQNPLPIAPKIPGSIGTSVRTLDHPPTPGTEIREYKFENGGVRDTSTGIRPPQQVQSFDVKFDEVDCSRLPEPNHRPHRQEPVAHYDFNALIKQEESPTKPAQISPQDWAPGSKASAAFYHSFPTNAEWKPTRASSSNSSRSPYKDQTEPSSHRNSETEIVTPEGSQTQYSSSTQEYAQISERHEYLANQSASSTTTQSYPLEDADDPFDVSDDDILMGEPEMWHDDFSNGHLRNNDLGIVVAIQAGQEEQNLRLRSFTSFIDRPDMLATYVPSPSSSPLNDSMSARIFCHFVNVTAPSISMFERHPANPSLIFQGQPVPTSQQHIWTYTFPTIALQNPAVLHAMLALSSLHIAKLQNGPTTVALKHYAIGLRRVAKCVGSPLRRGQPATLAAAMLLAFFECWSADHQKWSNHLLGARQLVREIDFVGMTRYIKAQKVQRRNEERMRYYHAHQQEAGHNFHDDRLRYQAYVDDVDENIVGMLMGKKLRYDQFGQVVEDSVQDNGRTYSERDLELYETQRDLFWWYCKQDAYQGILGGGKLFMEYSLWSHCPPRAPLGRLNATYGTFDHLILLMGRLSDFAAKDLKRKRLQLKANGGLRPPEMPRGRGPRPEGQAQSFPQMPKMPQMPDFSGMVPGVKEAELPMGFTPSRGDSPSSQTSDDMDLEAQRLEAEEEWQDIRNAFAILQDHFGEDFNALGPEFSKPIQTPFGPALQYRTYGIAGIWMNYYMALISCHRSHPSMPPAAMVAAGMAARQTASFANELGRIAAGIAPDSGTMAHVNPAVGAALIESSTCLFVCGVQYQNAAQRSWTVNRLRDIGRLTGWQTAHAIATGCETSWCKAAEMGRGPPYTRTTEERVVPDIWASSRRVDRAVEARGGGQEETRLVVSGSDRLHFALGVLGLPEDFDKLNLDNDEGT